MSDAPERIWVATWRESDWREGDWDDNEGKTLNEKPCIQYVRADRIEALTAERDEQIEWVKRLADMQIASEAKLAKAVEGLRGLMQHMPDYADTVWQDARATLAEIERSDAP
jgi:hypothetical protein